MRTRYDDGIERLRAAARPDRPVPPERERYVDTVRRHAYRVTDADVDELRGRFSEDELFEQTVSAAVAAGLVRLDAALGTLRGGCPWSTRATRPPRPPRSRRSRPSAGSRRAA